MGGEGGGGVLHRVRGSGQSNAFAGISTLSCSLDELRKRSRGTKVKTSLLQRFLQQPESPSQDGIRTESLCFRPSESTGYNH